MLADIVAVTSSLQATEGIRMTENGSNGAGTLELGGDLPVKRLGFGAMRLCGPGIWGEPEDPGTAEAVLRRVVEMGINLIDTADAYGP